MTNLKEVLLTTTQALQIIKPDTIAADDPITEDNWNKVVHSIMKLTEAIEKISATSPALPLVGYKYFRFPGEKLPWDLYPATQQTDWLALHTLYPGDAVRMAGGNASKFKESSTDVSYDENVKGDGGGQKDALQAHTHSFWNSHISNWGGTWLSDSDYWAQNESTDYHSTGSASGRIDSETRMKNITVEVYEYRSDLNNH